MRKENVVIKQRCHSKLALESFLIKTNNEIPHQVRDDSKREKAFTLIELLVVVLIIGILAAVAVPQYKKAVWRSRNTQLKQIVSSVAQAMETYYMANGVWPVNFDELDLDLPLQVGNRVCTGYSVAGTDHVRKGKDFEILITSAGSQIEGNINAVWTEGPYKCDGFFWGSTSKKILCREYSAGRTFCTQIERGSGKTGGGGGYFYNLP